MYYLVLIASSFSEQLLLGSATRRLVDCLSIWNCVYIWSTSESCSLICIHSYCKLTKFTKQFHREFGLFGFVVVRRHRSRNVVHQRESILAIRKHLLQSVGIGPSCEHLRFIVNACFDRNGSSFVDKIPSEMASCTDCIDHLLLYGMDYIDRCRITVFTYCKISKIRQSRTLE
ncbi:hypothetical protein DICVIV_06545 [Dictyocaulus viviparus]|uniref:Uncharacterized protein n=1 Tax=Dictyocaulus viviparus TaxID=29172 RepID=A0A0D8XU89_DICVI|nr:hypothetical protein DICVIV_06545 [Dictyocaulus viviparus]